MLWSATKNILVISREQFFHLLIHEDPGGQLTKAMLFRVKSFAELSLQGLPNDMGLVTTTTSKPLNSQK